MSNDLISRSAVMELIESKFVDGCLMQGDKNLIDGYCLLDEVSDLPTAYDMDKVVERLEERKSLIEYARIPKSAKTAAAEAYSLAIRDVKAGGINADITN